MHRISNLAMNNTLLHNVKRHQYDMDNINNQIATQNRIRVPHEDPTGTANMMAFRSEIDAYSRYDENAGYALSKLNYLDGKTQEVIQLVQNIREMAVQGANGVYGKEDMALMAADVEQQLRQIVMLANSKFKGDSVFSGHQTNIDPYETQTQTINGQNVITKVEYKGDAGVQHIEIDRSEYVATNIPGKDMFWAENQRILSEANLDGYVAASDSKINIDGVTINITMGDNLQAITDKINNSGVSVKARIDHTAGVDKFVLETTRPHAMWVEDLEGGTIMQELGVVAWGAPHGPNNYATNARVYGGSLFDVVMNLRDALSNGDHNGVNRGIGDMDQVMANLTRNIGQIGASQRRIEDVQERLSNYQVYAAEIYSEIKDVDMAEAITNLKTMEYAYEASLKVGSKTLLPTLMDYIR